MLKLKKNMNADKRKNWKNLFHSVIFII